MTYKIEERSDLTSFIRIRGKMVDGFFIERLTRFSALVRVEDKVLQSFLPNPGRMYELLTPGVKVILRQALGKKRKTSYDLVGVYYGEQKISVDSRVPNRLVLEALRKKDIKELSMYHVIKPEYPYGHTRFDFLLSDGSEPCLLEVKSCTLVKNGVALFPDAKTERGRRHVEDLLKAKNEGYRTCVLFIIQRTDANVFSPNDETDPEFGKVLRRAVSRGVEVYAYCSEFVGDRIILREKVEVKL